METIHTDVLVIGGGLAGGPGWPPASAASR
jgi:hypothetical protein